MWIPVIGVLIGVILGIILPIQTTTEVGPIIAVLILSCIYAIVHAARLSKENEKNGLKLLVYFSVNTMVAVILTLLGKRLNISIYLAPVLFFGVRIFDDIDDIIKHYLEKIENKS